MEPIMMENGKIIFDMDLVNLCIISGKFKYANGDYYKGDWKNDKKDGDGAIYWQNNSRYIGSMKEDKIHGHGISSFEFNRNMVLRKF